MALLQRELHRHVRGPEISREDRWVLVFDTDTKRLYIEHQLAYSDAGIDETSDTRAQTMDIAEYLTQGGQTAGHRELWRLLRTLFEDSADATEDEREAVSAVA
jgi:hypothetical protein